MSVIFKFVMDTTQTPNSKVKIAAMNHLRSLAQLMEPGIFANVCLITIERQFLNTICCFQEIYRPT